MSLDVILAFLLVIASAIHVTKACPPPCMCLPVPKNVHCSRKKLPFIPEGIPIDVHDLYLNVNRFENPVLQRSNFSAFKLVKNLYLNDCGIERIGPDTFIDLRYLRYLALNNNRLRVLDDYTFRGLSLDHLFLGYNPGVIIAPSAFHALVVNGLHLQSCEIKSVHIDVIKPLNDTLQTLILENNTIETFTEDWMYTFRRLKHLRLGRNPFHCNCELRWLHNIYTNLGASVFSTSLLPSCTKPPRLRGKYFSDLHGDDFSCDLPVFKVLDVDLGLDSGTLYCKARGNPTPRIIWLMPSGISHVFASPKNESVRENHGALNIRKTVGKTREIYVCMANNPAGNVSMNLTVTWPPISVVESMPQRTKTTSVLQTPSTSTSQPTPQSTLHMLTQRVNQGTSSSVTVKLPLKKVISQDIGDKQTHYGYESAQVRDKQTINTVVSSKTIPDQHDESHFTLVQLVSSIVGTFILTLLLCVVLFHFYYRHQARLLFADDHSREKTPENVYVTSEIDEQTLKMMTNNQHNQMRELTG